MPIYEYRCENDHVFDVIQRIADEPLSECTECGAPAARVLQPPAVHFKGSGFYNTDYGKRKGAGAGSSDGSKESSGSDSRSSSKSDSGSASDSGSGKGESKATAATAD
jgi:putative FmdB family regulatory protein